MLECVPAEIAVEHRPALYKFKEHVPKDEYSLAESGWVRTNFPQVVEKIQFVCSLRENTGQDKICESGTSQDVQVKRAVKTRFRCM